MRKALLLSGLVLAGSLSAQQTGPDLEALDRYIADAVVQFDQPGLAVGIVKDGNLVWSKGYGKLDLAKADPVTPRSIFHVASISKAFTAAAIGLLVDDGKLDWDDPVQKHMPEFRTADPYVSAHMTVTDLLCHRAGYITFDNDLLWYGTNYTQPEILARHAGMPLTYEFRTRFGYSNLMYIAAAQLIEHVSGKTWDNFITERILQPLGMTRTTVETSDLARFTDVALPHVRKGQDPSVPQKSMPYQEMAGADGATGINSCVEDLAKWDAMWADEGKANDKPFLSAATFRKLTSNHLPMEGRREGAALGWFLEDFNGNKVITHSGGMPGFILNHAVVPDQDFAVIALGNGESYSVFAVTNKIMDLYLGDGKADPVARMIPRIKEMDKEEAQRKADRAKARQAKTKPSIALDSLAGTYTDKIYGDARIEVRNGKAILTLVPAPGLFSGPLTHWHHDTWEWHHDDPFLEPGYITFSFDTDHRVTGFKINLNSPDFHFYKLDFKRP